MAALPTTSAGGMGVGMVDREDGEGEDGDGMKGDGGLGKW